MKENSKKEKEKEKEKLFLKMEKLMLDFLRMMKKKYQHNIILLKFQFF